MPQLMLLGKGKFGLLRQWIVGNYGLVREINDGREIGG